MNTNTQTSHRTAELLPNGYVRVDCRSGLVRLWERNASMPYGVSVRSGNGRPHADEVEHVARILGTI